MMVTSFLVLFIYYFFEGIETIKYVAMHVFRRPKVAIHIMKLMHTQLYNMQSNHNEMRMCPEHEFATCINIDTLFARFRQIYK